MARPSHEYSESNAALGAAFDVLGKRWTARILYALGDGPLSFSGVGQNVDGISDSVLSTRLSELAHLALVDRSVDGGPPIAVTYRLTPAGSHLVPALAFVGEWAAANLPARPLS